MKRGGPNMDRQDVQDGGGESELGRGGGEGLKSLLHCFGESHPEYPVYPCWFSTTRFLSLHP